MIEFLKRWLIFVKERFSPLSHILLIFFYFSANAVMAFYSLRSRLIFEKNLIPGFFVIFLIFFHLRVFDEIKDLEKDKIVHPERPLARGLISVFEAKIVAYSLISIELILSLLIGMPAFIAALSAVIYSLLMYKEFFCSSWLKLKIEVYALTHTFISCFMSLFVFSCVTGILFVKIPGDYFLFIGANWLIFNIFEFGRKIFVKDEEKDGEDSYSKKFGSRKAVFIVVFMAAVAVLISFILGKEYNLKFAYFLLMGALFILMLAAGIFYSVYNNGFWSKTFRALSSFFILLYYAIIVFS